MRVMLRSNDTNKDDGDASDGIYNIPVQIESDTMFFTYLFKNSRATPFWNNFSKLT